MKSALEEALINVPVAPVVDPSRKWLPPLEYLELIRDDNSFRQNLVRHEKDLKRFGKQMEDLEKGFEEFIDAGRNFTKKQNHLSNILTNFQLQFTGSSLTDAEHCILGSLNEFGNFFREIAEVAENMWENAEDKFITPLKRFRKEKVHPVLASKKQYEDDFSKFSYQQLEYLGTSSSKKEELLLDLDEEIKHKQKKFVNSGLDYILEIQEVQECKKFEFVEILQVFMNSFFTTFEHGNDKIEDLKPFNLELQKHLQGTRESFVNAGLVVNMKTLKAQTSESFEEGIGLHNQSISKLIENTSNCLGKAPLHPLDIGTADKKFSRSGVLFRIGRKKSLGSTSVSKVFCQFNNRTGEFTIQLYDECVKDSMNDERFKIKGCTIRDDLDRRFCFEIKSEETSYIFQATSSQDHQKWVNVMKGKDPVFERNAPRRSSSAKLSLLDDKGFAFFQKCLLIIETRGLDEEGLYRIGGSAKQVSELMFKVLDQDNFELLNLECSEDLKINVVTSAVKRFLRNLLEPLVTFGLYKELIDASKDENRESRVRNVLQIARKVPQISKEMLILFLKHLRKVGCHSKSNKMTPSNLAICLSPSVLRPEEESVNSILDLKFCHIVLEILIINSDDI